MKEKETQTRPEPYVHSVFLSTVKRFAAREKKRNSNIWKKKDSDGSAIKTEPSTGSSIGSRGLDPVA
eukprot:5844264-Pyramimonas_sp.AAC.1